MARKLGWIAVPALLLLVTLLAAPFLLTTEIARFALGRLFPENRPVVGGATLGLSGTLVLRDLVLHEAEGSAEEPLVTAREIGAAFQWTELFSRRIRRVHG
ncbi:MAG: hypothetical protein ACREQY_24380, partial [Candidatus Binatia bacterium]